MHHNLTIYVNNGTIFTTSTTIATATHSTIQGFKEVLWWLHTNGLSADLAKSKLMIFLKSQQPDLTGGKIWGAQYADNMQLHNITTIISLQYLRVFISTNLKWDKHVSIIVNQARSTIRGISILGNSVWGLDFMNWCHVYNMLVIPILMYGAQVWFIGVNQKGLLACMQVAQNDRLHKITRVFKMTPLEPLHNLM